ncbi:hypothetical protein A3K78_01875 [Candidatus Bathyarchaeota archaeon RBG_13_52_12]|nr:MAG: hypothetical protein A3K78_01875 [Candidatus Bathyarchaeota archaeon RBG_13_52_12]
MDMKHLYVRHIVTSQAYSDATLAERKKWFEEYGKFLKEHGFILVFWGTPWGVPESLTTVAESDKSLDEWAKSNDAWGKRLKELGKKGYGVSATTIVVTAPE